MVLVRSLTYSIDVLDVEALSLRSPSSAEVERDDGQSDGQELLRSPGEVAPVRVEAMAYDK